MTMTESPVGASVRRLEDPALLRGRGRFVDDLHPKGCLAACFVRSPHAHALINGGAGGIDASAALAAPGVHAVYTARDIRPHLTEDRLVVALPSAAYRQQVDRPILADTEVCYVGEPVAMVIADDRYLAEDAAALVAVDYDPLPAAGNCRDALGPDAPRAHHKAADNVVAEFKVEYGDCAAAFAAAPHVFQLSLTQHKGLGQSIECRGVLADYDHAYDRLTLWDSTQTPHEAMRMLVRLLGCDENKVRVITADVGGGFGPKLVFYSEEVVVALAAKLLRRPVKWVEDRREHFTATTQERDQYWDMEVAADKEGRLIALRGRVIHDHGAYTARGINVVQNAVNVVPGPYKLPNYRMDATLVLTNRVPTTPVRGAGHPQGTFAMERALDLVARELGIDRAEIRRRNLIPGDAMPYETPLMNRGGRPIVYDSGDYPKCQGVALERADYEGFAGRRDAARAQGRYRGIGVANYVKGTGRGPYESAVVRVGTSGRISVYTGATAIGQGTVTMLTQLVAGQLGGDVDNISVVPGDTATVALGLGSSASRVAVTAGSSVHLAAIEVRKKVLKAASRLLEASEEDLEIAGRQVRVRGVPDMAADLADVARMALGQAGYVLPEDEAPGLEATAHFVVNELTYANGTHVVEVEVDIETGAVEILDYRIVSDCGRMINPVLVDGQIAGGAVHGIGNALFEHMIFDDSGQPQTATLAEYLTPTAPHAPNPEILHEESPTPLNPLGVKGVGESGTVPATAAIVSAVEDALSPFGVRIAQTPITPPRIVELVRAADRAAGQ